MGNKTISLYLIQSPASIDFGGEYDQDLLDYYDNSIAVKNIDEFLFQATYAVMSKGALIKKLVIGGHGSGTEGGYGGFYIGNDFVNYEAPPKDKSFKETLDRLKPLASLLDKDADVYIMACKTGKSAKLLTELSKIWRGVRVHAYTGDIETADRLLWISVEATGEEIVCVPGVCVGSNRIIL